MQYSIALRNARLSGDETTVGTTPHYKIFDGLLPADCATADAGTELVDMTLPSDWQAAPSGGSAGLAGTWQEDATASGLGRYFRMYETTETTCHMQGLVAETHQVSLAYALNVQVDSDSGKTYICTTAGTSGGASPPTGTGTGIADGTVVWDFVAATDAVIEAVTINAPQTVTVTAFTRTVGNA